MITFHYILVPTLQKIGFVLFPNAVSQQLKVGSPSKCHRPILASDVYMQRSLVNSGGPQDVTFLI